MVCAYRNVHIEIRGTGFTGTHTRSRFSIEIRGTGFTATHTRSRFSPRLPHTPGLGLEATHRDRVVRKASFHVSLHGRMCTSSGYNSVTESSLNSFGQLTTKLSGCRTRARARSCATTHLWHTQTHQMFVSSMHKSRPGGGLCESVLRASRQLTY